MHGLGKRRNANRVLGEMSDLLNVRRHVERNNENVYYLNKKGAGQTGAEEVKWGLQVEHCLMRVDVFIKYGSPADFKVEHKMTYKHQEGLSYTEEVVVSDATFTHNGLIHFVEVDHTQSMRENLEKLKRYDRIGASIKRQYNQVPVLVFYVKSEKKKERLMKETPENVKLVFV